jgi:polysaccharide export outer membrane protein
MRKTTNLVRTFPGVIAIVAFTALTAAPQTAVTPIGSSDARVAAAAVPPPTAIAPRGPERVTSYILGPDDQIIIHAFQATELSDKPIQIQGDGFINLPLVGKVKASGLSVGQLENALSARLKDYVRDPQVAVYVADYRSQPVSVVGAVNTPGVVQLKGRKTLVEVIALAGGLKAEAGNTATITRDLSMGRISLPGAKDDSNGQFNIATVNLHNVMDAKNPHDNVVIEANDIVMIPKAQLLYVVGEVQKPGGYVLTERDSISVLQAVALAGGLTSMAQPKKARILYQYDGQPNRTEVATNVRKILDGTAPDVLLHPDDVLFVPSNLPKSVGGKALETAMNMAGVAVWRF